MASTYTPIATTTVTGTTTRDLILSSIPSTYTDLRVVISARGTNAGTTENVWFYIGSYASDMSNTTLQGDGSTASSTRDTGAAQIVIGQIAGGGAASGTFGTVLLDVFNYANTTTYKTCLSRGNNAGSLTSAVVGLKRNTAAISTLTFFPQNGTYWAVGSTFTLYGIKAA